MNTSLPKRYETTVVAILFFTWGTVFLDRMSQLYLAPYFAPEFHLSESQVGFLASAVAVSWALSSLVFGAVSDRFGRRTVLIPGVLIFSLLSWLSGMAHSFHQLFLIRALMGVAEGPCWTVINAINEETSDPAHRGRNVGIVVSAAALIGLFVAPILTTQVAAHLGWRWGFFIAGAPGLLMAFLLWKFVREPKHAAEAEDVHGAISPASYLAILKFPNIGLCCVGAAGFMGWLFLQNVFAPLYITEAAHQPGTTAGFLLGAAGLGSFFIGLVFPALSDRIGRKSALLISAVLSAILPVALCVPSLYSHLWLLAGILFLTQGGQAMASLVVVLMPAESVPPQFIATAIGMTTLVGEILGGAFAPTLGGAMAEKFSLATPLWMASGCMILVVIAGLFFHETPRPKSKIEEFGHGSFADPSLSA
ncbi:MAG TPA: MFS transporter [Candidatus Acidoferrales bacterium]|nr:MFS transporter [Candidatus Acidoferrales bacterium]